MDSYKIKYYIESQRICSKLGGGFAPASVPPVSLPLDFIVGNVTDLADRLIINLLPRHFNCVEYVESWDLNSNLAPAENNNDDFEMFQYFYHPDHLGSSSFITNVFGQAEQHLQHLPFGEIFVSQRNTTFDSRYKFTGKEHDPETDYTYFGARYYDSDLSMWLSVYTERGQACSVWQCRSVDPLASKYPSLSPFAYVANNPIRLVDPDGMQIDEWEFNLTSGQMKWVSDKGGDSKQHINFSYQGKEATASFNTTKAEADQFRENMSNRNNEGDWGLVGGGSYVKASAGFGPMFTGSSSNFEIFSQPGVEFIANEKGFVFGGGLSCGLGLMFIFGSSDLKGGDLAGQSFMMSGGMKYFEGEFQTSSSFSGVPNFDYVIINTGVSIGTSISFGTITTTITERQRKPLSAGSYWNRPPGAILR